MSEPPTPPVQRYKFVQYGGGIEELDRFAIRDRIRGGEITGETELAIVGTDQWQPAALYPELGRYLEIAATRSPAVSGGVVTPSKPRTVESMGSRMVAGLTYPIAGGEAFVIVGLIVLGAIPLIGILATLATTVIMVQIVRASAEGRTRMPLIDTSQLWELVVTWLRVMFITCVALLPVLIFGSYALVAVLRQQMSLSVAMAGIAVALAIGAVYYPACLATIAVWDSMLDSLNPPYVLKVIRHIGRDYFAVIGVWFVASLVTTLLAVASPFSKIPILGGMINQFLSLWSLFYVAHLLGYAVYRHAPELGWE